VVICSIAETQLPPDALQKAPALVLVHSVSVYGWELEEVPDHDDLDCDERSEERDEERSDEQ